MNTLLPTHLQPRRAHTLPLSFEPEPTNTQPIPPTINNLATAPTVQTWFTYFVGIATVIGLVVAIIAVVRM